MPNSSSDGHDNDRERMNSDYIIADGNVQTAQGLGGGVVIGKGSRQYPHEPGDLSSAAGMDWDNWRATRMNPDKPPRWRDLNGVPFRLCAMTGHYSAVAAFDAAPERPDGLLPDCRQCLKDKADAEARERFVFEAQARARDAERKRRERRTVKA